jgi:hypothetical protein
MVQTVKLESRDLLVRMVQMVLTALPDRSVPLVYQVSLVRQDNLASVLVSQVLPVPPVSLVSTALTALTV